MEEKDMPSAQIAAGERRHRPVRPDPRTGEVPAGPGDAGLEDRPEINAGSHGSRQMSNTRLSAGLGIGLGVGALIAVLTVLSSALF